MTTSPRAATPAEVAEQLRTSEWWVREQARRRRVPHLRMGRGRVAFLPEHIEALARLAEVQVATPEPVPDVALLSLGATPRSRAAHLRRARA